MTNYKNCLFAFAEIVLKPSYSFKVKVVGRLVEKEVIRLTVKSASKKNTHFLLTTQFAHEFIVKVFLDAKTTEQHSCIALSIPSFHFCKLILKFGYSITIFIIEVRLSVKSILLFHDSPKDAVTHKNSIHNCILVKSKVVLTKY